jgi:hypothetical protein
VWHLYSSSGQNRSVRRCIFRMMSSNEKFEVLAH